MKRPLIAAVIAAVVCSVTLMAFHTNAAPESGKMLRHVVLFKFKSDATKEQVQGIVDALVELPKKINSIVSFEHGLNNSGEGRSKGFTHCFLVTFKDEAGRDKYLPHPAHDEFVKMALPMIEDVLVVDYWAGK